MTPLTPEQLLTTATKLHQLGYQPEFGYQDGKRPLRKRWPQEPLTKLEAIYTAAMTTHPTTVGISTNPDGATTPLVVVDNDSAEATHRHQERIASGEWPDTPFVVTTPKGTHYYYRQDEGAIWGSTTDAATELDIRAWHGFIVTAPSIRPDGGEYTLQGIIPHASELPFAPPPPPQRVRNGTGGGKEIPLPPGVTDIRSHWVHDSGTKYLCKAHDDHHGSLSIRYMEDGEWAYKCFSGCTTQEIKASVDLTNAVKEPEPEPNPCTRLEMINEVTGETVELPCNSKRCNTCGPRLSQELEYQMNSVLGKYGHVHRFETRTELDLCITRTKKQTQRAGDTFDYVVVGDEHNFGWIAVTSHPLLPGQGLQKLSDWMERIAHAYRAGLGRLRRTNAFRAVSRLAIGKVKSKSGQRSVWQLVGRSDAAESDVPDTMEAFLADLDEREWFRERDWVLQRHRLAKHLTGKLSHRGGKW